MEHFHEYFLSLSWYDRPTRTRSFASTSVRLSLALLFLLIMSLVDVSDSFTGPNTNVPLLIPSQVVTNRPQRQNRNTREKKKTSTRSHPLSAGEGRGDVLIPSQVKVSSQQREQQQQRKNKEDASVVPAQGRASPPRKISSLSRTAKDASTKTKKPTASHNKNTYRQPSSPSFSRSNGILDTNHHSKATTSSSARGKTSKKKSKKKSKIKLGNLPDIEWGSIPMEHLRQHPNFVPLPKPEELLPLEHLEDVRTFRQESWQWDALHDGRCTTSQAVAALGFIEPKVGQVLGVPSTWQKRGGVGVYHRLRQPALRTLKEMNEILLPYDDYLDDNLDGDKDEHGGDTSTSSIANRTNSTVSKQSTVLWKAFNVSNDKPRGGGIFAAKYVGKISREERQERRRRARMYSHNGLGIRMLWGNAQESTSVLTALNYFTNATPGVVLKEIGMCGAGLDFNQTDDASAPSLLIGATPDALIEYPDGQIEALEVKNHCPFVLSRPTSGRNRPKKQFAVRELPFKKPYIFPLYVPQLMLEMLCLGPKCRSAVMVRQTATSGALILRMHRDDEWMDEMLYWLERFYQDYVERGIEPPLNFFYESETDGPRYRRFLERTKELASKVDLVARLPSGMVQRAGLGDSMFLD